MMLDSLSATTAVGSQTGVGASSASSKSISATAPSEDFSEVLGKLMSTAADVLQTGEQTAIQGLKGAASPLAVVNSVMAAQQTLHTALAIRDKVVSAYQEIARMTI
jgi:flagellar hook-basal body complex protein FliE